MLSSASRSRRTVMVVALVITLLLQIWVGCSNCKAGATRLFPHHSDKVSSTTSRFVDKGSRVELLHKYLNGRAAAHSLNKKTTTTTTTTAAINTTTMTDDQKQKGFEENKRRVPSCPDPLHN